MWSIGQKPSSSTSFVFPVFMCLRCGRLFAVQIQPRPGSYRWNCSVSSGISRRFWKSMQSLLLGSIEMFRIWHFSNAWIKYHYRYKKHKLFLIADFSDKIWSKWKIESIIFKDFHTYAMVISLSPRPFCLPNPWTIKIVSWVLTGVKIWGHYWWSRRYLYCWACP